MEAVNAPPPPRLADASTSTSTSTSASTSTSTSTSPAFPSSSAAPRPSSSSVRNETPTEIQSSTSAARHASARAVQEGTAGHSAASAVDVAPSQPAPGKITLLQRPTKAEQTEQRSNTLNGPSGMTRTGVSSPSSSTSRSTADVAQAQALGEGQPVSNRPTTPSQRGSSQTEAQPRSTKSNIDSRPASADGYLDADGSSDGGPERPRTPSTTSSTSELDPSDPATSSAPPLDSRTREPTITAEGADSTSDEGAPVLDHVLLSALQHPRDRILLLRAEVEMERFVSHPSASRLPLSPPHFQPNLNSYQRLLIHRLADIFGITREVEAVPQQNWGPPGAPVPGIVVLVKGPATKLPTCKLASIVAPPSTTATSSIAPALVQAIVLSNETSTSTARHSSDSESPARGGSPSSSCSNVAPPSAQPQVFKILPRSAHKVGSTASSPAAADDDSTGRGKARRELTLEEREAAYREARERIFAQQAETKPAASMSTQPASIVVDAPPGLARPSSAGSTYSRGSAAASISGSRAESTTSSYHSGYHPGPVSSASIFYPIPSSSSSSSSLLSRSSWAPSLRPSAPSFDPSLGWNSQGYEHDPYQQPYYYGGGPGASAGLGPPSQVHNQPPSHTSSPFMNPYVHSPPPPPLPHPNHAPYPHPTFATVPPPEAYSSGSAASAWATPRPPHALPSPSLSTSSGSSYQSMGLNNKLAPGGSNQRPGHDGGYLMRFPEGGIIPYQGSSLKSGSTNSSQASLNSTGQGSAAARPSETTRSNVASRNGERMASSASVQSLNARPHSSAASVESCSSGNGKATKTLLREGTVKGKGKERAGEVVDTPSDALSASNLKSLHPSLPVKPEWPSKSNGGHRALPDAPSQSSSPDLAPSAQPPATMRAGPNTAYTTAPPHVHPASFRPPPPNVEPPQVYAAASNGYQPPEWYPTYPHVSTPPYTGGPGYPYYPEHRGGIIPGIGGSSFPIAAPSSSLLPNNELRRPPPRSTELFDPSKPLSATSNAAGTRPSRGRGAMIRGGRPVQPTEGLKL